MTETVCSGDGKRQMFTWITITQNIFMQYSEICDQLHRTRWKNEIYRVNKDAGQVLMTDHFHEHFPYINGRKHWLYFSIQWNPSFKTTHKMKNKGGVVSYDRFVLVENYRSVQLKCGMSLMVVAHEQWSFTGVPLCIYFHQ